MKFNILVFCLALMGFVIYGYFFKNTPTETAVEKTCLYEGMEGKHFLFYNPEDKRSYRAKILQVDCESDAVFLYPDGSLKTWNAKTGILGFEILKDEVVQQLDNPK
jgi:hypothetical protein